MATLRQHRINYLTRRGLTHKEASTFADAYTYRQLKDLPYLRTMLRVRQLYINNQTYRGKSTQQINKRLKELYPDAWKMLRDFRKASVEKGDYKEPAKKSHHKLSDEELAKQRSRKPQIGIHTRRTLENRLRAINNSLSSGKIQYVDQYERLQSEKEAIEKRLNR